MSSSWVSKHDKLISFPVKGLSDVPTQHRKVRGVETGLWEPPAQSLTLAPANTAFCIKSADKPPTTQLLDRETSALVRRDRNA